VLQLLFGLAAIIGAFQTVATAVAEAEASIRTVGERHVERATTLWVNLCTLPGTSPLSMLSIREPQRFTSPLQKIARAHQRTPTDSMEDIQPYVVTPWEDRLYVLFYLVFYAGIWTIYSTRSCPRLRFRTNEKKTPTQSLHAFANIVSMWVVVQVL